MVSAAIKARHSAQVLSPTSVRASNTPQVAGQCVCPVCERVVSSTNILARHMGCHTRVHNIACTWPGCGKSFRDRTKLDKHTRTHNGSKPYMCLHCSMAFSRISSRNRHEKIHDFPPRKRGRPPIIMTNSFPSTRSTHSQDSPPPSPCESPSSSDRDSVNGIGEASTNFRDFVVQLNNGRVNSQQEFGPGYFFEAHRSEQDEVLEHLLPGYGQAFKAATRDDFGFPALDPPLNHSGSLSPPLQIKEEEMPIDLSDFRCPEFVHGSSQSVSTDTSADLDPMAQEPFDAAYQGLLTSLDKDASSYVIPKLIPGEEEGFALVAMGDFQMPKFTSSWNEASFDESLD